MDTARFELRFISARPFSSWQFPAKSAPDGYSLFVASVEPLAINPHVYKSLPYDPARDFVGVAPFVINPFCLVSRPDFPASSMKDVVAAAKQNPGKYTYASWGIGSTSQIGMEMVKQQSGIDVLHVPSTGEAPAVTALMSAQVYLMVLPAGSPTSFPTPSRSPSSLRSAASLPCLSSCSRRGRRRA